MSYLTTIGGRWYFDMAFGLQRLTNQSLCNTIILLQKFNDMTLGGRFSTSLFSASDIMEAVRGHFRFYGMNAGLCDSSYIVAK